MAAEPARPFRYNRLAYFWLWRIGGRNWLAEVRLCLGLFVNIAQRLVGRRNKAASVFFRPLRTFTINCVETLLIALAFGKLLACGCRVNRRRARYTRTACKLVVPCLVDSQCHPGREERTNCHQKRLVLIAALAPVDHGRTQADIFHVFN
ncbi:hypothetical protein DEA98_29170 (plasmid) [Brucella pseudogrignonensis]|nr:hypothetical protein [Brucella pseudogrignonensis]